MGYGKNCYRNKQKSDDPDYCKKLINPFGCRKFYFPEIDERYFLIDKNKYYYEHNSYILIQIDKKTGLATVHKDLELLEERINSQHDKYKDCPIFDERQYQTGKEKLLSYLKSFPDKIDLKDDGWIIHTPNTSYTYDHEKNLWESEGGRYKETLPNNIELISYTKENEVFPKSFFVSKEEKETIKEEPKIKKKTFSLLKILKILLQLLYLLLIGIWLGIVIVSMAIVLMLTIIGFPLGIKLLKKLSKILLPFNIF